MATDPRLPKWVGYVAAVVVVVPLVLAILPLEGGGFFAVVGAMCFAASLGGLWWGDRKGDSEGGRAALGCLGALGLFAIYALWAFVATRWIFRR